MDRPVKWFSFAEGNYFPGKEPSFFDIKDKPWKQLLEDQYLVILGELQTITGNSNKNLIPYFNETLAATPASWTIFPLLRWGRKYKDNISKCPQTYHIINQIPGAVSCTFSVLKPHTRIKPHLGDSNVMYRCHLTLKCEDTLPGIGMRVGDKTIGWENGKAFAFCDAHQHEVWNNTDHERWVLIVDVIREEFLPEQKKICDLVNATLWWQLKFQKRYFIKHLPRWSRNLLMRGTAVFMK
jgi:aspartyl/asparaginyl beta-hydroxylase (cupin superfamily)